MGVKTGLTERDEVMLGALARFGIARTTDLLSLAFPSTRRDTASRRLRLLFDAGSLESQVSDHAHENVYCLGPLGRRWAAERGLSVAKPPRAGREHYLGIVRTWADLARACHDLPWVSLRQVIPEWELRHRPEAAGYLSVPDLLVELSVERGGERGILRMAVEVDLATEAPTVLRRKVTHFRRLLGTPEGLWGWPQFGLAFAVSGWSERRQMNLQESLEESWPGWWLLWKLSDGPACQLRELCDALTLPLPTPLTVRGVGAA